MHVLRACVTAFSLACLLSCPQLEHYPVMLLGRTFMPAHLMTSHAPRCFGVVQWNVLADWAARSFPGVDDALLDWSFRQPLILTELRGFLSRGLIVCVEEVEVDFFDELRDALHDIATCTFEAKLAAPGEAPRDGCAMCVPRSCYDVVSTRRIALTDGGKPTTQVALASVIEDRTSGLRVHVAVTHLKAKGEFESVRARQVQSLLAALTQDAPPELSTVIVGDFNDVPGSPAIQEMVAAGWASAYPLDDESAFTTSKVRVDGLTRRMIDYIWFRNASLVSTLSMPTIAQVETRNTDGVLVSLPSAEYPSDHLAIGGCFDSDHRRREHL